MLKYLWTVTEDLLLAVTYVTWMHIVLGRLYGRLGRRIHGAGIGLSVLACVAFAIVKNNTNKIISSRWNHYIFAAYIVLAALFLLLSLIFGRREKARFHAGGAVLSAVGSALSAVLIFYTLPKVMLYPFNFNTMGNGYLSSYYGVRLAGWTLALLLLLVYARRLACCAETVQPCGLLAGLMNLGAISYAVFCFGRFFIPWVNRAKWLKWPVKYTKEAYGWAGSIMSFTGRNIQLFIFIAAGLAVVLAAIVFIQNTRVKDPYDNPAQLRKLRARNRRSRRTAVIVAVAVALFAVILTWVKAYDTRVIELSAPETYTVSGDEILIPLDAVNDGHLHRYEYRTEKNIDVRWIVVRKPGSASYGVGLDACEVCGNAGYSERNGQVICKRCDVVMNINTIGFKGGCNPIPLAYEVKDGNLVFRMEDILAGEKEFR
ncbi:MAG: DUF2318 domain-containing protein [Clostridia bacterium]|nr:DUF2318 domain-containing protein [Clostridia bacterium]